LKDRAAFEAAKGVTVTLEHPKVKNLDGLHWWREEVLSNLLDEPWEVRYYVGIRDRMRRTKKKIRRFFKMNQARAKCCNLSSL
jgi:hypothetical protein